MTSAKSDQNLPNLIERLAVALVKSAHVSIWAADRNFKIVLWNEGAEKIYGHKAGEAVTKNYLELFVDEVERQQSSIDCLRIIDHDYRQHNCLAYDNNYKGERTVMLTNCFRITDPATGESYQAEIGIDIGDLALKVNEHRELREVGIERLALQKETLERHRLTLVDSVEQIRIEVVKIYAVRKAQLDNWLTDQKTPDAKKMVLPTYEHNLKDLEQAHQEDVRCLNGIRDRIEVCGSRDDLDLLRAELDELPPKLRTLKGSSQS